jgi:integrase
MPRRYSYGQVTQLLMQVKNPLRISILLALTAGVRACELYTIAPLEDQPESIRTWLRERFLFMPGCRPYTVRGKGGLVRTIMVPVWLSLELEAYRRLASVRITDRGIYRQSCYDIVGGKKFSNQFSRAAKKVLGFSNGAHGLRGTYAQVRLTTLVQMDVPFEKARLIVAQELGHFSPANLRYYLPGSCFHKFLLKGGRCELKGYDASELKMSAAADLHSLANASFLH